MIRDVAHPVIIDCDPGVDDMIALLLASASDDVDLLGVTTVCGNVGVSQTTANALAVLALAERADVPVATGASRALIRAANRRAEDVHGRDGLGGAQVPPSPKKAEQSNAIEFMANTVDSSSRPITLIATGPLTNVALFFACYPDLAGRLARLIALGGAFGPGNINEVAEFNIWADPEAAYRVLAESDLGRIVPTTVISLDVASKVTLDVADLQRLHDSGRNGSLAADALGGEYLERFKAVYGRSVVPIYDALTVVMLLRPDLITTMSTVIDVDTSTGQNRGRTRASLCDFTPDNRRLFIATDAKSELINNFVVDQLVRLP